MRLISNILSGVVWTSGYGYGGVCSGFGYTGFTGLTGYTTSALYLAAIFYSCRLLYFY